MLDDVKQMLLNGKRDEAMAWLETQATGAPDAEVFALLGAALYAKEAFERSAMQYEKALQLQPDNKDWQHMLALARGNAVAGIHVWAPDVYFFDREKLLATSRVPPGTLPSPPPPYEPGALKAVGQGLGWVLGQFITLVMHNLTHVWGKVAGYRDAIWTNWYRRQTSLAILTLAYMREQLNAHNLKNTYPTHALTAFQAEGQAPPPGVTHYRTADGTWNNLDNPKEGAAGTRFLRNVNNSVAKAETGESLLSPNPREISRKLLTRDGPMKEVPFLNMLAAAWIQFQNHDWFSHGENLINEAYEIPLAEDDPARKRYWLTKMFIGKTQPDPTRMDGKEETPTTFINEVTHWWDGSQLYGSDQDTVSHLRSGVDGHLRLNPDGTLPLNNKGLEETGFTRNWWIGLTLLHTLFAREHNAICDHVKQHHPDWDDNRLFNVARLVNAALIAKIHSIEWTPAILPNQTLAMGLEANWYGILTNLLHKSEYRKTVASINVRNPEMGGVVGNPINKAGQPFGLTQEFVEIYRLHSLLPEVFKLKSVKHGDAVVEELDFIAGRQSGSATLCRRYSIGDLLFSFGTQHPGQLVLNNYPKFMQELSVPGHPLYDMGVVDILRARERGVPRYNEFRRQLGLNPIHTFEDLTDNPEHLARLKAIYGERPEDVERLDLMIGTLAEAHRPTGFGFGETMFQIFILNATRRLQLDRFYTDSYNEETYTKEGLTWVDANNFKSVLLRHYPELARTGLRNVKNAFEPWDTGVRLDPARHPLRAFDKELGSDPFAIGH